MTFCHIRKMVGRMRNPFFNRESVTVPGYRNQGYNFTITSSTAYDQKWIHGRNIFDNIDYLVDTIFANYLSRPGVRQPILLPIATAKGDMQRAQPVGVKISRG